MILRLGLYQIIFLTKIPDHSIVNEAVLLTGIARKSSAKGFVNAVLRNALRKMPNLSYDSEIDRLSTEGSMPEWIVERWIDQFGAEKATSIIEAVNEPAGTSFRLTAKALSDTQTREEVLKTALGEGSVSNILSERSQHREYRPLFGK